MNCAECQQPIYNLCISERCNQPAQYCDNRICMAYKKHSRHPSVIFEEFSKLDKDIQQKQKEFAAKINLALTEFTEQIKFSRNQKIKRRHYQKLGRLFKKLNNKSRSQSEVNGREVKQAIEQVEHLGEDSIHFQRNFRQFVTILDGFRDKIFEQKDRYMQQMMDQESQSNRSEHSSPHPINNSQSFNQQVPNNIHQTEKKPQRERFRRVTAPKKLENETLQWLNEDDKQFIKKAFIEKQVKEINKVYTASAEENQYKPQAFKLKCSSLKNTLVVAKYKFRGQPPQSDIYFAGFTSSESSEWTGQYKSDSPHLSKIFWISQRMVFPLKDPKNKNVFLGANRFIFGNDLKIRFKKDDSETQMMRIGNEYSTEHLSQAQSQKLQACKQKMRRNCLIQDYQVYEVQFRND